MSLSTDVIARFARLGYTSDAELLHFREMAESEGSGFVDYFLAKLEKSAEKYDRWYPRLQAYAAECRRAVPVPAVEKFSIAEREQHRILLEKMREFADSEDRHAVLSRRPFNAAILSTTRVGLTAAVEVFGETAAVILEESERERWFHDVYRVEPEDFWWYAFAWWTISEASDEKLAELEYPPLPTGSAYWEVVSGVQWGSLAGGSNHELWQWDGEQAKSHGDYMVSTY